jgi:D-3-phosphoglycerate dehydrogenase
MPLVLVADDLEPAALDLLGQRLEVRLRIGLSPQALIEQVADCDGLIVRSGTRVTRAVIEAAPRLKIIGRAGTGVDNVDVEAATERGIWVVNAPDSNSIAVAEHVFALMLAMLRRLPSAWESLHRGEWERGRFRGQELAGKTLGIVGLGRTGSRVAERAAAFGMEVRAHDPFVSPEQAALLGVELMSLAGLLATADIVSLHVPGTGATTGLIGPQQLRLMKRGAYLVNCARGSAVDEAALLQALDEGHLRGAALDVFAEEPPCDSPLVRHPAVLATPHIAGMTEEAQQSVALAVAQQVLDVVEGRQPRHPVNAPALSPEQLARIGPHLDLARRLGRLYAQIAEEPLAAVEVALAGQAAEMETALITSAVLEGLLSQAAEVNANLVNARVLARQRGISVSETTEAQAGPYSSLVTLAVTTPSQRHLLSGTIMHGQPCLAVLDDFAVTFILAGTLLYTEHIEQPGVLGRMGTLLGDNGINISFLQVGRHQRGGRGVMVLGVDDMLSPAVLQAVCKLPSVLRARMVCLPPP